MKLQFRPDFRGPDLQHTERITFRFTGVGSRGTLPTAAECCCAPSRRRWRSRRRFRASRSAVPRLDATSSCRTRRASPHIAHCSHARSAASDIALEAADLRAIAAEVLRSSRTRRTTAGRRCERARARSRGRSRARSLPGLASARRERSTQPARQRANFLRAGVPSALLRSIVPRLSLGAARGAHASEPARGPFEAKWHFASSAPR